MTDLREKKLSSKKVFKGSLLDIYSDEVELYNGNKKVREYTKHPGAAAVIPILPDGKIGLIKQFRYPTDSIHIEILFNIGLNTLSFSGFYGRRNIKR